MRLVLAEKPSVARDLARALGCTKKEQGYFSGPRLLVTYAVGHLVRLAEPNEMEPAWGKPWRREALPMLPRTWSYKVEPRTEDQFRVIERLLNDRRVTEIVNATDAGREGESIFRRIYALCGCEKPVLRFWTSSLTEEAIAEAYARMKPASEYDNLAAAAEARSQIDWLIGMNHTRASTLHNTVLCSMGRVQTPTLAMIVRRHHEITNWVRTFFYEVHAAITTPHGEFIARALTGKAKHDFTEKAAAEAILADIPEGTPALVTLAEKKPRSTPPPQLHNLGELQKEANRRFGLTADRTLEAAQALYEAKAITYPRSSSRHLPDDMTGSFAGILAALSLPGREALLEQARTRAARGPKLSKRFVDSSKLSDHHAIIPTAKGSAGGAGGDDARKVYAIVVERFVTIFLPDRITEETRIDLDVGESSVGGPELREPPPFRARGTRLVAPGWTAMSGGGDWMAGGAEDPEDRQPLPEVSAGDQLAVLDAELVTKERKPPAKFTDASILAAMETAGKEIDDEALREAMRGRGLGTEATRAAILNRLLDLDYVTREGKNFEPTAKGIALIEQLRGPLAHLSSPELTGDMEASLSEVEAGRTDPATLLAEVAAQLRRDIPEVFRSAAIKPPKAEPIVLTAEQKARGEYQCPRCQAGLLTRRADQAFYGCSRYKEGCGFTLHTVVAGKELTAAQIRQLLSSRHATGVIKGFTSRAGKKFDAALVLSKAADWKVEFEFPR